TVAATDVADIAGNYADNGSASFVYHLPRSLKHRYTFNATTNANASSLTVPDVAGTSDATLLGTPVILSGDRVLLGGGASGTAGYVDLPNGLLSINSTNNAGTGQVTLEGWVKVTGNRNWSRIFDIGSSGSDAAPCCGPGGEIPGSGGPAGIDYLMLTAQIGANTGRRQFELHNKDQSGFVNFVGTYDVTNFNQEIHFVATWDERTGQLRLYENGTLVSSGITPAAMSHINDLNVWLGRSNYTFDDNIQGEFDDFRIYDRVLTTNEIEVNRIAGPDNNFGAPQALHLSLAAPLHTGQAVLPTSTVDFVNVSNANFSFAGVVAFSSSNPAVVTNDAAGVLYPIGAGTATITQSYAGFINTLTVIVTNEAPTAVADALVTSKDVAGVIAIATLLANDSDPDGGVPLSVSGVSATSTNGGGVVLSATDVTYTPLAGYTGPDLFTYTMSDAFGASATGNVFVYVVEGPVPATNSIVFEPAINETFRLTFRGTPGTTYRIRRATEIIGPWETLSTQTAPGSGIIVFTDPTPPAGQAFYHVITP
ncbi:MAG TPA: LamG-like jellyroll fold domain-containing protein, partial [Candidatus Acidoferrum sp.]|nr:LamG-like jellyroll fold domain-containing protein [Candidatus Acidoferrum sp.]